MLRFGTFLSALLSSTILASSNLIGHSPFHATQLETRIIKLEAPSEPSGNFSVLSLSDGRVYTVSPKETNVLNALRLAVRSEAVVRVTFATESSDEILSARIVEKTETPSSSYTIWDREQKSEIAQARLFNRFSELSWGRYRPTVLSNLSQADHLFNSEHPYDKNVDLNDNCFNRAHFWSRMYELHSDVKTNKVYVFFTAKYRREKNFKWWYHVAPLVHVEKGGATPAEIVLDPSFLDGPTPLKEWSLEFAEGATGCKRAKSLSEFYSLDEVEECVVITANMYHYTPNDLSGDDSNVTEWRCSDLKAVQRALPPPGVSSWKKIDGFIPDNCN